MMRFIRESSRVDVVERGTAEEILKEEPQRKFDIEATAYVGRAGRTHARFEVEYELLVTNRLILQPLIEAEIYGKNDPHRGIGAGLSSIDGGFRLRYEFRREFAPYIGLVWHRALFGSPDYARADGAAVGTRRVVAGLRTWF